MFRSDLYEAPILLLIAHQIEKVRKTKAYKQKNQNYYKLTYNYNFGNQQG